jgi:hypothetical protein
MAYTGSRHRRSVPKKSVIPAGQYAPDVNPSSIGAAAGVSLDDTTEGTAGGGTHVATVTRAAGSIRKIEVGTAAATNLIVLSDTQISFVAPANTAGAKDLVIYDGVGTVTKTGAITYS